MDFTIPADIAAYIAELDAFIEREIRPLERQDDNIRFFDHRREHARTDWDNDGQPRHEWEELLAEMKRRAKLREASEGALFAKNERKAFKKAYKQEIVKRSAVMRIVAAWIVTVPATAVLAAILFHIVAAVLS